jgi:flagellar biosynthesis/type III secretory pathway protein FliH
MHRALSHKLSDLTDADLLELLDEVSIEVRNRTSLHVKPDDSDSVQEKISDFLNSIGSIPHQ